MSRPAREPGDGPVTVAERLAEGLAVAEFRQRLAVPLTHALIVLGRERRTPAAQAPVSSPPRRIPLRLHRPLAVAVAMLAVGGVATGSTLWLAPAGNRSFGYNPGLSSSVPPAGQLGALSVLRRAQTDTDRGPGVQAALADVNNLTTGVRSNYVRVLAMTNHGPVVIVPVQQRNASGDAAAIPNALCVYYSFSRSTVTYTNTHCWSTQQLLGAGALAQIANHVYGMAPDGVASVTVAEGGWHASVPVTGNFFSATVPLTGVPSTPTVSFSRSGG
jgi:hypothetical protein